MDSQCFRYYVHRSKKNSPEKKPKKKTKICKIKKIYSQNNEWFPLNVINEIRIIKK